MGFPYIPMTSMWHIEEVDHILNHLVSRIEKSLSVKEIKQRLLLDVEEELPSGSSTMWYKKQQ